LPCFAQHPYRDKTPSRRIRQHVHDIALERVLERAAKNRRTLYRICSVADLNAAVDAELLRDPSGLEADAVARAADYREFDAEDLARKLRCSHCKGPIANPKRWRKRRYCSALCRQRARRARLGRAKRKTTRGEGAIGRAYA
jgi:hypothetical protein